MSTPNPFAKGASASPALTDEERELEGFLSTSGHALKFPRVGFTAGGTVVSWELRDDLDNDSGERQFWLGKTKVRESDARAKGYDPSDPNGPLQLMKVLLLHLQSHDETLRGQDWEGNTYEPAPFEDDDLMRTAWVRGSMRTALGKARDKAGVPAKGWVRELVGAHIEWTRGPNKPKAPGMQGVPHSHTCVWTPKDRNPHLAQAALDDPWASEAEPAF